MKPMKKFLLLLFALWVAVSLVDARGYQDVVYLKSGEIVKGVIIERTLNVSLKLQTSEGLIFTFQNSDVYKVEKEGVAVSIPADISERKLVRTSGSRGFFDLGGGYGAAGGVLSLQFTYGYLINPCFFVGLGVGVNTHFDWDAAFAPADVNGNYGVITPGNSGFNRDNIIFVPVYADFRVNFQNKSTTPFFDVKLGYSMFEGRGVYFNPNLGVSIGLRKEYAMNLGIGYNLQKVSSKDNYKFGEYKEPINDVCFKLGVEF